MSQRIEPAPPAGPNPRKYASNINSGAANIDIGDSLMVATVIEDPALRNRLGVFRDRDEAGVLLARSLESLRGRDAVVLAIPSGGIPIGLAVAAHLNLPFDLLIIRKLPIPGNPEAGFGAISLEGDVVLNRPMVRMLGLSDVQIERQAESVREELKTRDRLFRGGRPPAELRGRTLILTDDGLASGYTMMAAIRQARREGPAEIVVAVPTASLHTIDLLAGEVDRIVCLNIRTGSYFAVAEAYRNWYDLSRDEVVALLRESGFLADDLR